MTLSMDLPLLLHRLARARRGAHLLPDPTNRVLWVFSQRQDLLSGAHLAVRDVRGVTSPGVLPEKGTVRKMLKLVLPVFPLTRKQSLCSFVLLQLMRLQR